MNQFLQAVKRGCREWDMDYCLLRTDAPLDAALSAFLARRMARVK